MRKTKTKDSQPRPNAAAILHAIRSIAEERNGHLSQLKIALANDDIQMIKFYANKLVGNSTALK